MNTEVGTNTSNAEFAEIEAEIAELESYFGDLGLDDDDQETSSDELSELNAALAGSEFGSETAESSDSLTFIELADGVGEGMDDQQEFGWGDIKNAARNAASRGARYIAKKAARKWIKWCLRFVKTAAKFQSCAPKLALTIYSYKRGKYGTALKQGYSTAKCIKAKF